MTGDQQTLHKENPVVSSRRSIGINNQYVHGRLHLFFYRDKTCTASQGIQGRP